MMRCLLATSAAAAIILGVAIATVNSLTCVSHIVERRRRACWSKDLQKRQDKLLHLPIYGQQPLGQHQRSSTNGLPRIIHHMWLDKHDSDNSAPPPQYAAHLASLQATNPTFQFEFWNMRRVRALLQHPRLKPFEAFFDDPRHPWISRCDIARLLVFAHPDTRGGFYIDLDFYGNRSLGPLCDNRSLLLFWEPNEHLDRKHDPVPGRVFNGFFASRPKHPMWLQMLTFMRSQWRPHMQVLEATGPIMWGKFAFATGLWRQTEQHFLHHGYIMPYAWHHRNKTVFASQCTQQTAQNCFVYTLWTEGSGWQTS